jgi:hypothetical protein
VIFVENSGIKRKTGLIVLIIIVTLISMNNIIIVLSYLEKFILGEIYIEPDDVLNIMGIGATLFVGYGAWRNSKVVADLQIELRNEKKEKEIIEIQLRIEKVILANLSIFKNLEQLLENLKTLSFVLSCQNVTDPTFNGKIDIIDNLTNLNFENIYEIIKKTVLDSSTDIKKQHFLDNFDTLKSDLENKIELMKFVPKNMDKDIKPDENVMVSFLLRLGTDYSENKNISNIYLSIEQFIDENESFIDDLINKLKNEKSKQKYIEDFKTLKEKIKKYKNN